MAQYRSFVEEAAGNPIIDLTYLRERRDAIVEIASRHGATSIRVFGSAARGDARPDSDVDFVVTMRDGYSFFDYARLADDLETLLGREVDVVVYDAQLKPRLLAGIDRDGAEL